MICDAENSRFSARLQFSHVPAPTKMRVCKLAGEYAAAKRSAVLRCLSCFLLLLRSALFAQSAGAQPQSHEAALLELKATAIS